MLDVSETLR